MGQKRPQESHHSVILYSIQTGQYQKNSSYVHTTQTLLVYLILFEQTFDMENPCQLCSVCYTFLISWVFPIKFLIG